MKKLLALLLLSPLAFAKTINLTCEPVNMTVCLETCETLDQTGVIRNGLAPMVNASISIEEQTIGDTKLYFLDMGLGMEFADRLANKVVLTRDGDDLGEQFIGKNLTYSVDLLNKEYIYQVEKKENPFDLVYRQNHTCSQQKGLFD